MKKHFWICFGFKPQENAPRMELSQMNLFVERVKEVLQILNPDEVQRLLNETVKRVPPTKKGKKWQKK